MSSTQPEMNGTMQLLTFFTSILILFKGEIVSSLNVDVHTIATRKYCQLTVNCTFNVDGGEGVTSAAVTVGSSTSDSSQPVTVARCSVGSGGMITSNVSDGSLSSTGSTADVGVNCQSTWLTVTVGSANALTQANSLVSCVVTSNLTSTSANDTIATSAASSECTPSTCASNQTCLNECNGYQCVASLSTSRPESSGTVAPDTELPDCGNIKSLPNVTQVLLGSPLLISCVPKSPSTAIISWTRDSDPDTVLSTKQNLVRPAALLSDAGLYHCTVTDETCAGTGNVLVIVNYVVPPTVSTPEEIDKTEGDSETLTCNATGTKPVPDLQFYFTARQALQSTNSDDDNNNSSSSAPTGRVMTGSQTAPGFVQLTLDSLRSNDSGVYECVAEFPGPLYFTVASYSLNVNSDDHSGDKTLTTASSASASSSSQQRLELWKIAAIVFGAEAILVFVCVSVVVYQLKKGDSDNDTAPLDDEEEEQQSETRGGGEKDDIDEFSRGRKAPIPERTNGYYEQDVGGDDTDMFQARRPAGLRLPPIDRQQQRPYDDYDVEAQNGGIARPPAIDRRRRQLTGTDY